jgi:hypothetical protein
MANGLRIHRRVTSLQNARPRSSINKKPISPETVVARPTPALDMPPRSVFEGEGCDTVWCKV